MYKTILLFLCFIICDFIFSNDYTEYNHKEIISFEEHVESKNNDSNSSLTIDENHFKHLNHSLKWSWEAPNSFWSLNQPINYIPSKTDSDPKISTFVFWIYSKEPIIAGKLLVEFLKEGEVASYFEYGLNFTGWRGVWIAFDRDMCGSPLEGMDEVRFSAPGIESGTLYFDHIILSSLQDARHHTADFQAPYINKGTKNHWLILHDSWNNEFEKPIQQVTSEDVKNITLIERRVRDHLLKNKILKPLSKLRKDVAKYNITENADGSIKGVPIFFERYGETYAMFGAERYNKIFGNIMGLKRFNSTLLDLSVFWNRSENEEERKEVETLFITMIRHMLDQGFQAGSAMGTLHHLGYSTYDYYPAIFLMTVVLDENGLKSQLQQAMEWFSGVGEVKTTPSILGTDVDTFNTHLIARLTSILMLDSMPEKARYLSAFTTWLNNGYQYADGTRGTFKIDGTMFHHRHNYPAYAIGGLQGAVEGVYLLRNTPYKVSEQSHRILKNALLSMRFYSNRRTWPLSLSGRHPDGLGELDPEHFGILALSGSPNGEYDIDIDMAEAYLRLIYGDSEISKILKSKGFNAEKSPNGNRSFNYSNLNVHRRADWMVAAMGHSRYLWSTEIYRGENMFGRYITHGALQILGTGDPISNHSSGFNQIGWDWNHFPGTTATVLPIEELKADVKSLDNVSGYEEMLLSDESFSGGISIGGQNGAFGMKLHENDKYNGSLRARKSVFFFDNRIVALGSNIKSDLPEETHTTLFQVFLDDVNKPFIENEKMNTSFPYSTNLDASKVNVLSDGLNNYYYIHDGSLLFKKELQHSFHEEGGLPTKNNFALAAINHGSSPINSTYGYMIHVQPEQEEVKSMLKLSKHGNLPFSIIQQDSLAHIVKDKETRTTGYILFEAGDIAVDGIVNSVNLPSMVMTHEINDDKIILAACDPDLRFYEGAADEIYDEDGRSKERSVYSRDWIDNPSGKSVLQVTLTGKWKIGVLNHYAKVLSRTENNTTIEFECQHGLSHEVLLLRK